MSKSYLPMSKSDLDSALERAIYTISVRLFGGLFAAAFGTATIVLGGIKLILG